MTRPLVLVVDNGTLSLRQLTERLDLLGCDTTTTTAAQVPNRLDADVAAVVLSGTKVRAYDTEFYRPLVDLVSNADVPVLGICGGMQLIAVAAGGRLVPGPSRVGGYGVTLDPSDPLFAHVGTSATVFHRHTLYLEAAPAGFDAIGWSDHAPVEFLRSTDGRVVGSQAHLEFRSDGLEILRGFTDQFALEALERTPS